MKKKSAIVFLFMLLYVRLCLAQVITISSAHSQPVGNVVTVSGVVTNGSEFGTIRYLQDATGGIAVFSSSLSSVTRGDIITVTGTLDDYFNLLELNPVSTFSVNTSGNPDPAPIVLTPNQLSEQSESRLVQIDNAVFTNGGGVFAGNANYSFTANGETGTVRILGNTSLVGQSIPTAAVTIIAVCSQYQTSYQLLPRDMNDIFISSIFYITSQPQSQNISTSGFDVNYTTNLPGSTYIEYGKTPLLELGVLNGTGGSSNHSVTISGALSAEVYYVKAFSVNGNDTAYSPIKVFITQSNSTGNITAYFNRPVNTFYANAPTNFATQLSNAFSDTVAAYISRAQQTLDIAIYNFDNTNTASITSAINNAYNNGVQIRIICDGSNANAGMATLNPAIPIVNSPTLPFGYFGIMHNKFMVIDANSSNPNQPIVWTGSTNFTDDQLNNDANNIIIFQDQALAKSYTIEFEEMWGSSGAQPNSALAKFGPDKSDNTPHEFIIGGKRVENYFSPSDNVNNQILNSINAADNELYFALLVFTRYDLAYGIEDRILNHGVFSAGILDDSINSNTVYTILLPQMPGNLLVYDHAGQPGIMHHKYLIADQSSATSDALVLTGSHNWSTSANAKNDENTVVVHGRDIANQYYQEFIKRFTDNGGVVGVKENESDFGYMVYPNPSSGIFYVSVNTLFHKTKFELFDFTGKKVLENDFKTAQSKTFEVKTNALAKGIYLFKISTEENRKSGKIIIQ